MLELTQVADDKINWINQMNLSWNYWESDLLSGFSATYKVNCIANEAFYKTASPSQYMSSCDRNSQPVLSLLIPVFLCICTVFLSVSLSLSVSPIRTQGDFCQWRTDFVFSLVFCGVSLSLVLSCYLRTMAADKLCQTSWVFQNPLLVENNRNQTLLKQTYRLYLFAISKKQLLCLGAQTDRQNAGITFVCFCLLFDVNLSLWVPPSSLFWIPTSLLGPSPPLGCLCAFHTLS